MAAHHRSVRSDDQCQDEGHEGRDRAPAPLTVSPRQDALDRNVARASVPYNADACATHGHAERNLGLQGFVGVVLGFSSYLGCPGVKMQYQSCGAQDVRDKRTMLVQYR